MYAKNSNFITPLHYAAQVGNVGAINTLIAKGATVNTVDKFGVSPLYIAVENRHVDAVKALIAAGANVNLQSVIHTSFFTNGVYINMEMFDAEPHMDAAAGSGNREIYDLLKDTYFKNIAVNTLRDLLVGVAIYAINSHLTGAKKAFSTLTAAVIADVFSSFADGNKKINPFKSIAYGCFTTSALAVSSKLIQTDNKELKIAIATIAPSVASTIYSAVSFYKNMPEFQDHPQV